MRLPDDDGRLLDMLMHAREAIALCEGASYDDLLGDRRLQLALVKLIEVIGEAASRVSDTGRARVPGVPWPKVVGMRHRLVHDYSQTDYAIVWAVVKHDLPRLVSSIEPVIPPPDAGDLRTMDS